jgi:hypothetical protein
MSAMLESLSEQIRKCYEHAEECARKAAAQIDPALKQDFFDMEQRWLSLARSFEFSRRLGDFSAEARAARDEAGTTVKGLAMTAHMFPSPRGSHCG